MLGTVNTLLVWDNILRLGQQHIDQLAQRGECEAGEAPFLHSQALRAFQQE